MKIAHIVSTYPPYKGGMGNLAHQQAKILVSAGHQVTVFTPNDGEKIDVQEILDGVKVIRIKPLLKFGNAAMLFGLKKYLKDFDIVHLHYPFFGTAELLWLWKRGMKYKLALTYHMDAVGTSFLKWFFWLHAKIITPWIVKSADKVTVTSNDYAGHSNISRIFFSHPNIFIEIPPAIDTNYFHHIPDYVDLLEKHNLNKIEETILLFVGGLDRAHYFKGLPAMFKTMALLKKSKPDFNCKLVIIGGGDLVEDYKKKAKEMDLENRVIFAGQAKYNDLPRYYSLADLFILASIDGSEAFGLVLAESLACQTPVLASNLPGVRTVAEGSGGTFTVGNHGELAAKIIQLTSDKEKLKELGYIGREKVISQYSNEIVLARLLEVYQDLI